MTKHNKKNDINSRIESNRVEISRRLSGIATTKRLNNLNWLRYEISHEEPRTLFQTPNQQPQLPHLDFTSMTNLGAAYDYIIENANEQITSDSVRKIHSILCNGTHIPGGILRDSPVILDITVNGEKYHAPDPYEIAYLLNNIIYDLYNGREDVLSRAFNAHYKLILTQPFHDFNKRTARIIMNWFLIQSGYRPIAFNKRSDKQNYIANLIQAANGNTKEYTRYMKSALARTQEAILKQLKNSKIK